MDNDVPKIAENVDTLPANVKSREDLAIDLPDNLKESFEWTSSIRNIGKYGERLCDAITQAVHQSLTGQYSCGIINVTKNSDDSRELKIDVRRVMANSLDKNYAAAEVALIALQHVIFTSKENGVFKSRALITDADLDENTGPGEHVVKFRISAEVWNKFSSDKKGYRIFNPFLAFKYSPSTYKLYKLLCGQAYYEEPLSYNVDELMAMLYDDKTVTKKNQDQKKQKEKENGAVPKKKKKLDGAAPVVNMRYADFSRRILDAAKKTLMDDPDCDFYFEYYGESTVKEKQRGRPKVDKITFFVKSKKEPPAGKDYACDFNNKLAIDWVPPKLLEYLEQNYEITYEEAKRSHIIGPAFVCMRQHGDSLAEFILDPDNKNRIIKYSTSVAARKRYLMGMIKKHCKDAYGVDLGRGRSDNESYVLGNITRQKEK